jgi:Ser/Thr protein kinase RdoA (MazF antagonist)
LTEATTTAQKQMDAHSLTPSSATASSGIQNDDRTAEANPSVLSDEELRKLLQPIPTEEDVYQILLEFYYPKNDPTNNGDLNAEEEPRIKVLCQLDSYDDCNYKVSLNDQLFLLKITNGLESRDFLQCSSDVDTGSSNDGRGSIIHFQHAIMNVLHENQICTTVPVPSMRRSHSTVTMCSLPVRSTAHSPALLAVRLYTWVHGRPMSTIPYLPLESLIDAGQMLGRMDLALDPLSSTSFAAGRRYHQWDGKNTLDLRKFTSYISNPQRRSMVESILAAFEERRSMMASSFRTGVIMGDYNDANIIVNENLQFAGVIDFGDSVERYVEITFRLGFAWLVLLECRVGNTYLRSVAR